MNKETKQTAVSLGQLLDHLDSLASRIRDWPLGNSVEQLLPLYKLRERLRLLGETSKRVQLALESSANHLADRITASPVRVSTGTPPVSPPPAPDLSLE